MICPKCQHDMEEVDFEEIKVDRCPNCGGIWFDMLEKEHLKKMKGSESIDSGDPSKGKKFNQLDRIDCPVCHTPLLRMADNRQPHIWYESCPVCFGAFFDAGEFKDYRQETWQDFFRDLRSKERD